MGKPDQDQTERERERERKPRVDFFQEIPAMAFNP